MSERSTKKLPYWKDTLLLAAELAARNVYWRMPRLRAWVKRRQARRRGAPQVADHAEFKDYLRSIGVVKDALVMAHSSTTGLRFSDGSQPASDVVNGMKTAKQLLDDLMELVGETGTLVMPTHVAYQTRKTEKDGVPGEPLRYDPSASSCNVGLANELFWRLRGTQRSLHPYNTLAARGPLASELLHDNLNESKPLPHGIHSGYYRICQRNGLVVSIGIPLRRCMTIMHTAEDARDSDWPTPGFFEDKRYIVRTEGQEREWIVRQRRAEYSKFCLCIRKFMRDLMREGILHEGAVGGVRVDWAHSREILDFLLARNANTPYPYYLTWLVRNKP